MQVFVYLFDALGIVPTATKMTLNASLQSLFNQVTTSGGSNNSVIVAWPGGVPTLGSADVLLYFFSSPYSLSQAAGYGIIVPDPQGGRTQFGRSSGTLSELRPAGIVDGPTLANLAFHECMHNKLNVDDKLHAGDDGLAAGVVDASTTLSANNMQQMSAALSKPIPQFTMGMTILMNALSAQTSNDPLASMNWDNQINVGQ